MTPSIPTIRFISTQNPRFNAVQKTLEQKLQNYNDKKAGPSRSKSLGLAVRDPKARVIGGLLGATFRGWLHIDLLWVDRQYRKKGVGCRLVHQAEETARRRNIQWACVETGSFQAPDFYPKLGYRCIKRVKLARRSQGFYFVKKLHSTPAMKTSEEKHSLGLLDLRFETLTPGRKNSVKVEKILLKKLHSFSAKKVGAFHFKKIGLEVRNPSRGLVGGLFGCTYMNYLQIDLLWVNPSHQGKGLGWTLVHMAEERARWRGCVKATAPSYDFQTPEFFRKAGYRPFVQYKNFPKGHTRSFLLKDLRKGKRIIPLKTGTVI